MSNVILPSIREMFPEYLAQNRLRPAKKPHSKTMQSPASGSSNSRSDDHISASHPHTPPMPAFSVPSDTSSHDGRQTSTKSPSFPAQGTTRSSASLISNPDPRSTRKRSNTDSMFYSFDILRSDPSSPSLQHIASSAYPNRGVHPTSHNPRARPSEGSVPAFRVVVASPPDTLQHPTCYELRSSTASSGSESIRRPINLRSGPEGSSMISFPVLGPAVAQGSDSGNITDSDDDELSGPNSTKRHVCPTCFKRFNRPSSLRIHVNTHTGATPFRCPWPNCGREFNVNSNMRRHYRNHTIPGTMAVDHRRRRKRATPAFTPVDGGTSPTDRSTPISSIDSPPISNWSASEESDDDILTPMDGQCDDLHSAVPAGALEFSKVGPYNRPSRHHSQSRIRTLGLGSASSPSLSPSPPPDHHVYTPSTPYFQSSMNPRVSTTLRPAFHHPPVATGESDIKEEQMTEIW